MERNDCVEAASPRPAATGIEPDPAPDVRPDATPTLSVVIVSYNTREMTLACIESLYAETRATPFEAIVIDNASTDGSADAIAARFPAARAPTLRLIRSAENLGFARANNVAAAHATGRYLLLLNPDTVILNAAVDRLVAFAGARPAAQIWGGRTVFADGTLNDTFCFRHMTLWTVICRFVGLTWLFPRIDLFSGEAYGRWGRDTEREVDVITGCFIMLPLALWRRLGGFDLAFVMYAEEADLCLRARALGARPRITPLAEIVHHGGASETVPADKVIKVMKGKITLIRKHWRWPLRPLGVALFAGVAWTRTMGALALGRRNDTPWPEIWRRRAEWRRGYRLGAPTLPPSA